MNRYLILPATDPLIILDPNTGEPALDPDGKLVTMPRAGLLRVLVSGILQADKLDVLDAQVLRGKLLGDYVIELSEPEHTALSAEARKPSMLTIHAKSSPDVIAVLRAIVDAPSTKPAQLAVGEAPPA
jgi:hypothetical protein